MSKVDLHIHSKYSHESPEWVFRKIDFPHSGTDPKALYKALKESGMDYVTITDHDRIDGCLEIAEHDDVFISEEVTTYFPEDHCEIHLLVWGIQPNQHTAIQPVRRDIYELQKYLQQEKIVHAVAHPLKSYDTHFGSHHFEKLLLMFTHFETINGLADSLYSEIADQFLNDLRPEHFEKLAKRHGIEPVGEAPWQRFRVGGSNDHSELKVGIAYTETAPARTTDEFLAFVKAGECQPKGINGTPISVSHAVYKSAYLYLQSSTLKDRGPTIALFGKILSRFIEGENPTNLSFGEKIDIITKSVRSGKILELAKSGSSPLLREIAHTVSKRDFQKSIETAIAGEEQAERRAFIIANILADQLGFRFFQSMIKKLQSGHIIESLEQMGSFFPLMMVLAPYGYAFQSQTAHQNRLRNIAESLFGPDYPLLQKDRRAWFTDTLHDVNGVSTTIRKMASEALKSGKDLTIITCCNENETTDLGGLPIHNFVPVGEFDLPEYEFQKVAFPPVLRMIDYIQRERFSELIISTPGFVGLCGLLAGKVLGLKTISIYHTDFPKYVNILTDDSFLETITWKFMHWFYDQTDLVYVNSDHYRKSWIERGISPDKIATLPRGLDITLFHPSRREPDFWKTYGKEDDTPVVLYAGRVSREKNLDIMVEAVRLLKEKGMRFDVAIVGDGPYLNELRGQIPGALITGYLGGMDLAKAYASSDIFAFASTTDTYGNVVVEALASGLPCIVSDIGGPKDLVKEGETGAITRGLDVSDFARALQQILEDTENRRAMSIAARESVSDRDWGNALERFWLRSER